MLQVTPALERRTLTAVPDATWGLHLIDGNIALGTLTRLVSRQARRWLAREGR